MIDAARAELRATGRETVLFIDEVHRFSKAQQDALLPGVENRWVTLIAATTENPFFSVISPLLSRCLLLTLESLTDDDIARGRPARSTTSAVWPARSRRRRRPGPPGPAGRRRRPPRADLSGGGRRAPAVGRGSDHHRPGDRRDRGRPGRGPLRPPGRPALRRDQRVHQVDPRLRRRRGAALPGPDDRGGGGPAVHRAAAGDPGQRGHRAGRPDRAAHRGGRGPGGAADRDARGAAQPRPGDHRARDRARSRTRSSPRSTRRSPTSGPARSARCRRTCATPTTRARRSSATATSYIYSHDEPSASPSSSTRPTSSRTRSTTSPPCSGPRRRSRSAGSGCAGSSGAAGRPERRGIGSGPWPGCS